MNSKNLKTTAIALAVLLLLAVFYIFHLRSEMNNQKDSVVDFQKEKVMLQEEIDSLDFELSSLEEINVSQDSTLQATKDELQAKNSELKQLLSKSNLSEKEVRNLRAEVQSLKSQLRKFKSEIQKLQSENEELRLANDTLNIENFKVRDSLSTVNKNYQKVSESYSSEKEKVNNTLSISNFNITPLKVRKSGKEVEKTKAARVNKLKVDFKLDPNQKATDGSKQLYICIYKPDGSLANFENGSKGSFVDKNGKTINFSDRMTVNYRKNTGNNVEFDWDYDNFTYGTYKIEIYQNGFKIGEETRTLNK